jgi:hypothetical protein
MLRRLLSLAFGRRYVLLRNQYEELHLHRAVQSESGWVVRAGTWDHWNGWVMLLPGGEVEGAKKIKGWQPFLGWGEAKPEPIPELT